MSSNSAPTPEGTLDLLSILRSRISSLPDGDHMTGLKAILQHVEVAAKHLTRGQDTSDDTAFTDVIFRTNQAFEGALKEAYRVLAGKDPMGVRPFDIENYFQQHSVLRTRVLSQFTIYRTQWRNPSAHDYRLEFDEDEALLAIVTVSAFAIVLSDQIAERLSFEVGRAAAIAQVESTETDRPLLERTANLIEQFATQFSRDHAARRDIREIEIIGALTGFLSKAAPELMTVVEPELGSAQAVRPDLMVTAPSERLIVEVKLVRGREFQRRIREALLQVSGYMTLGGINQAVLFSYLSPNNGAVSRRETTLTGGGGRIIIISTGPLAP